MSVAVELDEADRRHRRKLERCSSMKAPPGLNVHDPAAADAVVARYSSS
jgi:hypothetical protein